MHATRCIFARKCTQEVCRYFHDSLLKWPRVAFSRVTGRGEDAERHEDADPSETWTEGDEKALREKLKALGGRWDPAEKLWRIPYGSIRGDVELEERILPA